MLVCWFLWLVCPAKEVKAQIYTEEFCIYLLKEAPSSANIFLLANIEDTFWAGGPSACVRAQLVARIKVNELLVGSAAAFTPNFPALRLSTVAKLDTTLPDSVVRMCATLDSLLRGGVPLSDSCRTKIRKGGAGVFALSLLIPGLGKAILGAWKEGLVNFFVVGAMWGVVAELATHSVAPVAVAFAVGVAGYLHISQAVGALARLRSINYGYEVECTRELLKRELDRLESAAQMR